MSEQNQFLLYTAPDGAVKVDVYFKDETVWLTQKALAELFGVQVPGINRANSLLRDYTLRYGGVLGMRHLQTQSRQTAETQRKMEYTLCPSGVAPLRFPLLLR